MNNPNQTNGFTNKQGSSVCEVTPQGDVMDEIFGQYLITGKAMSDRLFHKFTAKHLEQKLPAFIKILRPEVHGGASFESEFLQTASLARAVVHSSLVPILDAGKHAGQYFVVEEMFEGFALGRGLESNHFDHDDKIKVINQIGQALIHLHEQGIVHGELNPSHVFITVDDVAKISGYGFPELIQLSGKNPPVLKVEKRRFMAPEVLAGDPITIASDVYSLASLVGCIFASEERWVKSDSRLSGLNLHPQLLECLQKAMHRDWQFRHKSVEELMADLNRLLRKAPFQATLMTPIPLAPAEAPKPAEATEKSQPASLETLIAPQAQSAPEVAAAPARRAFPFLPVLGAAALLAVVIPVGLYFRPAGTAVSAEPLPAPVVEADLPVAPAPSHLVADNELPGFQQIRSLPSNGLPWERPAVLYFSDATAESTTGITSVTGSSQISALLTDFELIRQNPDSTPSLAALYNIVERPQLIVVDAQGKTQGRFSTDTPTEEIQFSLQLLHKGLFPK
ncbi:MAG: protein kinase [Candidatus Sumerlaeia bacterium]|nr:protein kinase [Candidatus Sumerlaeia bacterium]